MPAVSGESVGECHGETTLSRACRPAPQPRLDRLVGVLPIAQAEEANGIAVLALALEVYTTGFVVTL